ncbi:hypothetical protein [Endozoicomonas lisbonensis]|uniref:Small secreted protein n=1 Tax=Endozoicomonas lisbonensis TaxID=3120522 RepID=A0ABV2SDN6_9GAMM
MMETPFRYKIAVLLLVCATLSACSTGQQMGHGIVLREELLAPVDRTDEAKTGALSGATLGSIIGGISGAAAGAGCAAVTFGLCAPAIPGLVAYGAVAGGGIGGASGALLGYGYGTSRQGNGLHHYTVAPCSEKNAPIDLRQYSPKLMPPGTLVLIHKKEEQKGPVYSIAPINPKELHKYPAHECPSLPSE